MKARRSNTRLRRAAMAASSPPIARAEAPPRVSYAEACAHRESGRRDKACGLDTSFVSRRITQRGIGGSNLNQRGKSKIIRKVDREYQSGVRRCCSGWENEEDRIRLAREIKRNLFVSRSPEDPQEIGAAEDLRARRGELATGRTAACRSSG